MSGREPVLKLNAKFLGMTLKKFTYLGGCGVYALFYHLGYSMGLFEGGSLRNGFNSKYLISKRKFIRKIKKILEARGFGRVEIVDVDLLGKGIVLKLYNGFESTYVGPSGEPICAFTRGYISGLIEGLTGLKIRESRESKCKAMGHSYCEFKFYL